MKYKNIGTKKAVTLTNKTMWRLLQKKEKTQTKKNDA